MSDSKEIPSYLKEKDGFVDVTLVKPETVNGQKVSTLRVREPIVSDGENARAAKDDAAFEINLIANLCEVTPAEVRAMSLRNYARLQAAVELFTD